MNKKILEAVEISDLLNKYIRGEQTPSEAEKVRKWIKGSPSRQLLLKEILNEYDWGKRQELLQKIDMEEEWKRFCMPVKRKRKLGKTILRYAAVLLLPLAIGAYFLFRDIHPANGPSFVEIAPGIKKAQLVLSNGTRIELSGTKEEQEIGDENVVIKNRNQLLSYVDPKTIDKKEKLVYNQLILGRGEEYQIVLSDGTKVWLNSETTLKYPVHFAATVREVELTGEAYFEVAKNPEVPFVVKTEKLNVEVLGTSFNVSAYNNETGITTTLLEGRVKIKPGKGSEEKEEFLLMPNEQSIYNKSTDDILIREVDAQMYVNWTKGFFAFDDEPLAKIMNRLTRWYNINVIFKNESLKQRKFSGKLPRFENCNVLLEMIAKTTQLKINVDKKHDVVISSK